MILYLILMFIIGWSNSIRPVCPAGYRAISVSGERSLVPKNSSSIVTPDADFPECSPVLSCPEGQKWAVHPDGSALTNSCLEANCPCSAFRHCPAYASTLFRQFGADERISLFQVIDPLVQQKTKPHDPYDTPYLLFPGFNDSCFLTPGTINMVWPPIKLGDHCLRGTLGKISTNPSLFVCAPSAYVFSAGEDYTFDVELYMKAYRT